MASLIWLPIGEHGIERGHGFLEDHGDVVATDLAHLRCSGPPAGSSLQDEYRRRRSSRGILDRSRRMDRAVTLLPQPLSRRGRESRPCPMSGHIVTPPSETRGSGVAWGVVVGGPRSVDRTSGPVEEGDAARGGGGGRAGGGERERTAWSNGSRPWGWTWWGTADPRQHQGGAEATIEGEKKCPWGRLPK